MGGDDELGVLSQVCCLPARLPAWAAVPCPAACALSLLVAPLLPLLFAHFSSVCVQYYHLPFVSDRSLLWDAVYAKGSPNYTAEAPWPYFHHDRWAPRWCRRCARRAASCWIQGWQAAPGSMPAAADHLT